MSFYDINYIDRDKELTPPKYRLTKFLSWLNCLNYPLQWLRDLWFGDYKVGAVYPDWTGSVFFGLGERVVFTDLSVYECISQSPVIGTPPSGNVNSYLSWQKIQDVFIGVDERIKYNSQMIVLEYALNHYYRVPTTDPQIYITTNSPQNSVFVIANSEQNASNVVNNEVFASSFVWNTPSFTAYAGNFTVSVPTALFATLGATVQDQENNIRQFVNKYKLSGLTYNVVTF